MWTDSKLMYIIAIIYGFALIIIGVLLPTISIDESMDFVCVGVGFIITGIIVYCLFKIS